MSSSPQDRMRELQQLFFESAQELLQRLTQEGLELENRPADSEVVRSVRRTVHTLKGDSAACGYTQISELAHELEDVLTPERAAASNGALVEVVLAAADVFQGLLQAYRSDADLPACEALRKKIRDLLPAPQPATAPASSAAPAWSEYEQAVIADAAARGSALYHVAVTLDPLCPVKAAVELLRKALAEAGDVLALRHDEARPAQGFAMLYAVLASSRDSDWITRRCRVPGVVSELRVSRQEAEVPLAAPTSPAPAPAAALHQQEFDILNDIARALTSSRKLDEVLHTIMEKVAQYFQPDTWSLLLADEQTDELYFAIATGPAAESLKSVRLKIGEGIAGWVARHDEPVIVPDVYSDPRFAKRIDEMVKFHTRSIVCVPMRSRGRVLGVIQLINCSVEKMGDKEIAFLQALCDHAALAIDNARAAQTSSPAAEEEPSAGVPASILRVDAARIDTILNLVGEMVLAKSMLHQAASDFDRRFPKDPLRLRLADALAFQARVLNDLQKSVMKVRMVPVEQLFWRFPRVVRDVARAVNKDVALQVTGEDTDLDKSVLDMLVEPLTHLVRNAVDHGIEAPEERLAAGKPAQGTVRLHAFHQGNQVAIEVSDDGRGIDRRRVIARALERGLIAASQVERLSDHEALDLIFHPGLSTAQEVTRISGRGIGMDVVRNVLQQLKGTVSIETEPGRGTTFRLKVPLTLAIIKAMLFRVADRLYAVPLGSVLEITRVAESEIHQVGGREVLRLRDQVLTLVRLGRLAGDGAPSASGRAFVVVIALAGRKFGLLVDRLVGEEELVIKALQDPLVASDLVSGASILGDGTVVLILNLPAVVDRLGQAEPLEAAV